MSISDSPCHVQNMLCNNKLRSEKAPDIMALEGAPSAIFCKAANVRCSSGRHRLAAKHPRFPGWDLGRILDRASLVPLADGRELTATLSPEAGLDRTLRRACDLWAYPSPPEEEDGTEQR